MSTLLEAIAKGWSWKIGKPAAILSQNSFGNVIVQTEHDWFFRIIPEDPRCVLLGTSREEMEEETSTEEFKLDWEMKILVEKAEIILGKLDEGQCYHLVIPGILGGKYHVSNIKKISLTELLDFSGYVASKIENLPDGTKVEFRVIE
jgi:hypothetical protein